MGHGAESKAHSLSLSPDFTDAPPALGWTVLPKAPARDNGELAGSRLGRGGGCEALTPSA